MNTYGGVCFSKDDTRERRAVILALDITDSMRNNFQEIVTKQFPKIFDELGKQEKTEHHFMIMGVGDVNDSSSKAFQTSEFVTSAEALSELQSIVVGGSNEGNAAESYILPWYFAAKHTSIDCFEKRGKKGFLFTFGDDGPAPSITEHEAKEVLGIHEEFGKRKLTARECLDMAQKNYECYHFIVKGDAYNAEVVRRWKELLGDHVYIVDNLNIAETVIQIILEN